MTAAEVDFLKAEAFERWGGGDPAYTYQQGIRHSIEFYYYLNHLNKFAARTVASPSKESIDEFLLRPEIRYEGSASEKLSRVYIQKWAHFGFLQSIDAWSELRRTNQPQLQFLSTSLSGFELPPSRLTYPASEKTYNPNYAEVQGSDRRTVKIFWDVD